MSPAKAKKTVKTPARAADAEILGRYDAISLVATAEKDGRIRLKCSSWDDHKVILPGEAIEMRWQGGQWVLIKRKSRNYSVAYIADSAPQRT